MKKFIRFNYTALRNEAHVEYNETFDSIIVRHNPQALGVQQQYDDYKTALDTEVSALDVIRKSGYTGEINAQDNVRDGILRGFIDGVKSAMHHFDTSKRHAAAKLNTVIEHYGNVARKTFDEETVAIDDLLRELNDRHVAEVQLLSLNDWLTQLDAENQTFRQLMAARYAEIARRPAAKMKTARFATDRALRLLLNMIEALVMVNGIDSYKTLINELNAVSERYKNQLAKTAGKRTKNDLINN
ncbi:MAG: DUF6261 family protein [Prevotellaceae bacterium]|jgi:hypothetical protein|nr:DUF6261 family protein [Prevotellaceae bacterium]